MSRPQFKRVEAFNPKQISGCQLWLDGADVSIITLSGSNVTAWNDKSGNGYHMNTLTATATWSGGATYPTIGTPINGLQTVNFTPQAGLRQSTTLDGVKNLFWVGRIAAPTGSGGGTAYFLLGSSSDTTSGYDWSAGAYGGKFLDPVNSQAGIQNATASLITSDPNAVTNATFSSVNMPSAPNVSLLSVTGITGFTRYQGICFDRVYHIGWCGDLAEVVIFSTALTTSQREQVEGYLAQKWGLRSSLPGGHPGITSIIYPTPRRTATVNMTMSLRPYYTEFSPRSIAGCSMWIDGADPAGTGVQPANGATVSTWVDKSGNTNNGTSGTATFNRDSVGGFINFTGGQTYSITNPNVVVNQYFTIFVVEQLQNYAGGEAAFMGGNGSFNANLHMRYTTGGGGMKFGFFGNDLDASVTAFLTNSTQPVRIWSFSFLPSSRVIYLNGTSIGSDTNNIQLSGWGGAAIGAMVSYGGQYYNGKMREVMIYSGSLITAQRQQVESYLAQKWSLTASLPAGHLNTTQPVGIPRFVTQVKQKILPIITQRFPLVQTSALIVKLDGETYTGGSTWTDSVASANWSMGGTSYDSSTKTVVFSSSYAFADSVTNFNSNTHTVVMYYYRTGNSSNPYGYGSQVWVPGSMLYQISRSGSNTDRQISIYEPSMWEYSGTFGLSFNANTTLSGTTGWVMRAFVKNGSTGTFYLNGVADGTQTVASGVSIANREFAIGRDWRDSQGYLQAKVALFAMWNIALSASEIATIHANCKGQFGL